MKDFRRLKVWHKGRVLVLAVYEATQDFPKQELYGLTAQLRRAAASIPANIAEGCGRASKAELGRFLQIAMGLTSELEYHLLLAKDLGFLPEVRYSHLLDGTQELERMLATLVRKVKAES